jgi:protein TonB
VPLQFELAPLPAAAEPSGQPARRKPVAAAARGAASVPPPATRAGPAPEPPVIRLPAGMLPKRIAGEPPAYPEAARRLKLEGRVAVDMVIDEAGQPTQIRILESAGEVLDAAVLEALRSWRYEPTLQDGRPVRVRHAYRHTFARN